MLEAIFEWKNISGTNDVSQTSVFLGGLQVIRVLGHLLYKYSGANTHSMGTDDEYVAANLAILNHSCSVLQISMYARAFIESKSTDNEYVAASLAVLGGALLKHRVSTDQVKDVDKGRYDSKTRVDEMVDTKIGTKVDTILDTERDSTVSTIEVQRSTQW